MADVENSVRADVTGKAAVRVQGLGRSSDEPGICDPGLEDSIGGGASVRSVEVEIRRVALSVAEMALPSSTVTLALNVGVSPATT